MSVVNFFCLGKDINENNAKLRSTALRIRAKRIIQPVLLMQYILIKILRFLSEVPPVTDLELIFRYVERNMLLIWIWMLYSRFTTILVT